VTQHRSTTEPAALAACVNSIEVNMLRPPLGRRQDKYTEALQNSDASCTAVLYKQILRETQGHAMSACACPLSLYAKVLCSRISSAPGRACPLLPPPVLWLWWGPSHAPAWPQHPSHGCGPSHAQGPWNDGHTQEMRPQHPHRADVSAHAVQKPKGVSEKVATRLLHKLTASTSALLGCSADAPDHSSLPLSPPCQPTNVSCPPAPLACVAGPTCM